MSFTLPNVSSNQPSKESAILESIAGAKLWDAIANRLGCAGGVKPCIRANIVCSDLSNESSIVSILLSNVSFWRCLVCPSCLRMADLTLSTDNPSIPASPIDTLALDSASNALRCRSILDCT